MFFPYEKEKQVRQVKLETGLRAGEAPAQEWVDIDEKKRLLKVNKNLVVWALLRQQPVRSGCGSENHIQAAGPPRPPTTGTSISSREISTKLSGRR